MQGTHSVGAMVVAGERGFIKVHTVKFNKDESIPRRFRNDERGDASQILKFRRRKMDYTGCCNYRWWAGTTWGC